MKLTIEDMKNSETPNQETDTQTVSEQENAISEESDNISEDSLEQHGMKFFQRIQYKKEQYRKKTATMSKLEHWRFFLDYYKWNVIITVSLLVCGIILGKEIYQNTRPIALGVAIINNTTDSNEQDLALTIEEDYRNTYTFNKSDRFFVTHSYEIDPETYVNEIYATQTNTLSSYERLYYSIAGDQVDVIITDEKGILYCIDQDLVYPIENFFDETVHEQYADRIHSYESFTGDLREYAIDISDSSFVDKYELGYDTVYVLFPSNEEDNKQRAVQFLEYIFQ